MLGLTGQRPSSPDGKRIQPLEAHGLEAMSIGFLVDPDQAVVWRGPMVTQALTQLLTDTEWGSWTTWWSTCRRGPATSS